MDIASPTRPPQPDAVRSPHPGQAVAPEASLSPVLRLSGTPALAGIPANDPRLVALQNACAVLAALEAEVAAHDRRLADGQRLDPMRQVRGTTALEAAVAETRTLVRQLDEALSAAAGSAAAVHASAGRTHPKDFIQP